MDLTSLIEIVIAIIVIYFFIKFIVNPIARLILGIISFLILIYILQKYFGFNLNNILSPFGISLNTNKWGVDLNWISWPINYCIGLIKSSLNFLWQNIPKSINK